MMLPPDVPRCHGLKAGAPCPTPDDCSCQQLSDALDAPYSTQSATVLVVVGLILALSVASIAAWFAIERAFGADSCMTFEQARRQWPTTHLWWHGRDHCWDNQRRGGRMHAPVARRAYAQEDKPRAKVVNAKDYNELDAAADRDAFFRGEPLPYWPPIVTPHPRFTPWQERVDPSAIGDK